jgi:neutral ceramidase
MVSPSEPAFSPELNPSLIIMKKIKKILGWSLGTVVAVATSFVVVVGPWPVYKDSEYKTAAYYKEALQSIDQAASKTGIGERQGTLTAGWAARDITPKVGVPMGGYGGRPNGKRSTGVHDPLVVKAIALSDGKDTVVLVGSDMLQTLPNLLELIESKVGAKTPLTPRHILYHSSHSHCGPGGLAPGLAANVCYGKYDPAVVEFLSGQFAGAIIEAWQKRAPAKLANGVLDIPEFIRNRTRSAPVDSALNFCVVKQDAGPKCILMRYSAHPTVYGQRMTEFSAEYPGAFQRAVAKETGAEAIYLGGAVGSMGPHAPDVPGGADARVEAMGQGLAHKLLAGMGDLKFEDTVDIASFVFQFGMPPFQMRPMSPRWRLSPVFCRFFTGLPPVGRVQMARIGNMIFVGMPYDFSGETAREWRLWAAAKGINLWVTSHSGAYLGYLSPDKYYNMAEPNGGMDYETGLMGWFGPNTEAYMADLFHHGFDRLSAAPISKAAAGQMALSASRN